MGTNVCEDEPYYNIDDSKEHDYVKEIEVVGEDYIKNIPLYDGVSPLKTDVRELLINNISLWKIKIKNILQY